MIMNIGANFGANSGSAGKGKPKW